MSDDQDDPKPVELDAEALRRIEEDSEPAVAKERKSPLEDPGAPGGTAGTGASHSGQDD